MYALQYGDKYFGPFAKKTDATNYALYLAKMQRRDTPVYEVIALTAPVLA